ncbi:MAG: 50S ribosomal protein L6 [Armatimonadetes bacterium]|nr:50S ribosomal protein L6 [Armatimonadota bacterium]MDE2206869.1 50S ribosomal protein L6 [Armatimonadota bacterium]
MSRIGKQPIPVPAGVSITGDANGHVTVTGPKGSLEVDIVPDITFRQEDGLLLVERPGDAKRHRALHGLTRTLIANMVEGVTKGYTRQLEIQGVGYRAELVGRSIRLLLGMSHPLEVAPRDGITFEVSQDPVTRNPLITISGIDKQRVGQTAAEIRKLRKPEPYKGKGVRYRGEAVRRKAGKAAGKGAKK